ncbi:glucosamine-6-phosphate deaminase [Monoraphidium neglectum]|uniref:Glucosamine-6-phosphate deaminase n=1 Tax=Monoraphidium neglectum TaxID=145388 RepID=A0A0D2KW10_9CHLO|nr:glucosamine-6-phosphate deaminase [Monoraphidium neglectum]KIY99548.1 glucosamine-6-phosphate deaminase [Monoraphidium neglectum]|eukprot:XP_013898568.1 glucosamine-6-phosphate deaminase [Monoraphidium neglectum]
MVRKKPLSDADVALVQGLLEEVQPHQVFAAGDLSDPHGTHRTCLEAVLKALGNLKASNASWMADCRVWLYRGAWQEWGIDEMDMAVPLSPQELVTKRHAIYKHQSQKDRPLFPGPDEREFWQRSEARNRETAALFDRLGLPVGGPALPGLRVVALLFG